MIVRREPAEGNKHIVGQSELRRGFGGAERGERGQASYARAMRPPRTAQRSVTPPRAAPKGVGALSSFALLTHVGC